MAKDWNITKWCKSITDSGKDEYTNRNTDGMTQKFRLLDDDGVVYAYGMAKDDIDFEPLDYYMYAYGCTEIQYKNPKTGIYETL
jgi:hypothetical protein